jgi:hypothetical protein
VSAMSQTASIRCRPDLPDGSSPECEIAVGGRAPLKGTARKGVVSSCARVSGALGFHPPVLVTKYRNDRRGVGGGQRPREGEVRVARQGPLPATFPRADRRAGRLGESCSAQLAVGGAATREAPRPFDALRLVLNRSAVPHHAPGAVAGPAGRILRVAMPLGKPRANTIGTAMSAAAAARNFRTFLPLTGRPIHCERLTRLI